MTFLSRLEKNLSKKFLNSFKILSLVGFIRVFFLKEHEIKKN